MGIIEAIVAIVGIALAIKSQRQNKEAAEKMRRQTILAEAAKPLWERPAEEQRRIFALQNLQRALSAQRA